MALLTAGAAMANSYFYIDDFEVNPSSGNQITVPVKAHFDGRLNGFDLNITYPEGITPVGAVAGEDMTLTYMDKNGQNQTSAIPLSQGAGFMRFISAITYAGYWNTPNGIAAYGAVKWEAGDHEEMILLTLEVAEGFTGGSILLDATMSSGNDARGGTIDSPTTGSSECHVTVESGPGPDPDPDPDPVEPGNYFYIDNFEINLNASNRITVPVKAHFDGRLNGFDVTITYPEGLTPVNAVAGRDMTLTYLNKNGQAQTSTIGLSYNEVFTRFISAITIGGYWNSPSGLAMYGAVKWEAGDHDEMILLTMEAADGFTGGDILIDATMSSGQDVRGGIINSPARGTSECHVTVKSDPVVSDGNYFYIDDFEVDPSASNQITVPVKANFDARLNGYYLEITYPEGLTPVKAVAGRDMTVAYMDKNGHNQTKAIPLNKNDELTRFVGAIDFGGYWYGPNGLEMYGAVKWDAGIHEEMFLLTLQVDEDFDGGDILVHSEMSSGYDNRGGALPSMVVADDACHVTVAPIPVAKTPVPFISYDNETATLTVWSDVEGAMVSVYINDVDMGQFENQYTHEFTRTDENQEFDIVAYAKAEGKSVSDYVNLTITVEALSAEPEPADDNVLKLADAQAVRGQTVVIPLLLNNATDITAFQTDVYLPEGFEMVKQDGEFLIETSSRLSDHIVMTNTLPDGSVRILCYSPMLNPIDGNEGELVYITVKVPDNAEGGDYTMSLKNNKLTTTAYEELRCANTYSTLNVLPYIMGDANNSGTVTVTDVVLAARYALDYDLDGFVFGAADVNGDGEITVTDVVLIARLVLYPQSGALMRAPAIVNLNEAMSGEDFNIAAGETRTVTIALDNTLNYTAFQLDMMLPDGMTASNFRLTNRAASHVLDFNTLADGHVRLMCYSTELATIDGSEGALLTFDVTAVGNVEGNINVDGIEMVTADFQTLMLDAFAMNVNGVTAVNEIAAATRIYSDGHDIFVESPVDQVLTVSDMAGRAQQVKVIAGHNVIANPGNGVYIVAARGKTAKLMLK